MANDGSFETNKYGGVTVGTPYLKFSWYINSVNNNNNKTSIHYKVVGAGLNVIQGVSQYCALHLFKLIINGSIIKDISDIGINVSNDTVVAEGDLDIEHNSDGSKSFGAEIHAGFYWKNQENVSGSNSWTLPTIDRYVTINISQKSKDINSISINWSADHTISGIKYSTNGGKTYSAYTTLSAKSGTLTIKKLSPNTSYDIKVRVKRSSNSLETTSSTLTTKTYDYAKFVSVSNADFGENVIISKSNESGISDRLEMYVNNSLIATRTNIDESYYLFLTQSELDNLYKKYSVNSNNVNLEYRLITTCNSKTYTDTIARIIRLTGNAKTAKIKQNGVVKRAKVFIKQNGIIKRGVLFIMQDGIIKRCI